MKKQRKEKKHSSFPDDRGPLFWLRVAQISLYVTGALLLIVIVIVLMQMGVL